MQNQSHSSMFLKRELFVWNQAYVEDAVGHTEQDDV